MEDKEPPIISEIAIYYKNTSEAVVTKNKAPTKMEADKKTIRTLTEALDPEIIQHIDKIEITFAEDMNEK